LTEDLFEDASCKTIFSIIKPALVSGQPIDFAGAATHLRGEAELTLLSELSVTEEIDESTLARLEDNLRPMEKALLERRHRQLQRDIDEAQRAGDGARVDELVMEKTRIYRSLK
jgi:hypothetical protein